MLDDGVIHNANLSLLFCHFGEVNYNFSSEYCKAFGQHLRRLRLDQKLGMRQFALMADMEYSHLSKIERGVTNPTISTVLLLAETLGVPPSELLNFKFQSKKK
jgi:predicted transcriptional regulator